MNFRRSLIALFALYGCVWQPVKASDPVSRVLGATPEFTVTERPPLWMKQSDERTGRNVLKLNLTQLALKNVSMQYEFGFHKNMSVGLGVNFVLPRVLPDFFSIDDSSRIRLPDPELRGWAITPEFRFYPGSKQDNQAPHGFYLAAYARYARYTLNSSYNVRFVDGQVYGYDFHATYAGLNGGLMLGYQWIIAKHLSIDLWIVGAGAGRARLNMKATSNGFTMDAAQQQELRTILQNEVDDLQFMNFQPTIHTTPNSAFADSKAPMLSLRGAGLCIGFAF